MTELDIKNLCIGKSEFIQEHNMKMLFLYITGVVNYYCPYIPLQTMSSKNCEN